MQQYVYKDQMDSHFQVPGLSIVKTVSFRIDFKILVLETQRGNGPTGLSEMLFMSPVESVGPLTVV